MKKNILILIIAGLSFLIPACKNTGPALSLKGTINVEEGTIYLQSFRNKMFFTIDSTQIVNGQFSFTRQINREDLFGLTLDRHEEMFPWFVFLQEGEIAVNIDVNDRYNVQVDGSPAHDLYASYLANRQNFNIDSFIENNTNSVVAAYILYRDYSTRLSNEELEINLARFDPSLDDVSYLVELRNVVETRRSITVEGTAADFSGVTPGGEEIRLSDFSGNYVLLRFWASWCGPCRRDNPALVQVSEKYRDNGFRVMAVSLDSKREPWLAAIEADNLDWHHVSDLKLWDSEPAKLYGVRHIPANFLIDPSGKIIARNVKGEELDKILGELY
jgi:thiol-disulfide isomerase/thioredoxin